MMLTAAQGMRRTPMEIAKVCEPILLIQLLHLFDVK